MKYNEQEKVESKEEKEFSIDSSIIEVETLTEVTVKVKW